VDILKAVREKFMILMVYSDLHATKFTLMVAEFLWATTLLLPGDTFARTPYILMAYLCPSEVVWGLIWLACGLGRFHILATGEYHTKFAFWLTGFTSLLWWFATISIWLSAATPPAAASSEIALSIAATWLFVRVGWIPFGTRSKYASQPK
jgi:Na+/glutamate symporter